ncbi:hypothetical protein ELH21_03760 [Rhizobium leguminosarum]|nr:hypothetical protein ELH21_03760 [Rhizobium leguminosarum]
MVGLPRVQRRWPRLVPFDGPYPAGTDQKACLTSLETLEKTYGHHHPDHQANAGAAFTTGRAGRRQKSA